MSNNIAYLVFSGGGAMGTGYAGVLKSLNESKQIESVRAIAGTSAGSICSALIATGIKPQRYENLTKEVNIGNLLGKGIIGKKATPLYELIKKTIHENILDYTGNHNLEEICQQRIDEISEEKKDSIRKIQELATQIDNISIQENNPNQQELLETLKINFEELNYKIQELDKQFKLVQEELNSNLEGITTLTRKCRENGKVTFRDLDLFRAIDPKRFKGLIITAVRQDNGELILFNVDKTPDVEIAKACQASSAIPVVFKPVEIDGVKYVDGGYRDNIPMNHFNNHMEREEFSDITNNKSTAYKRGTLIFAFRKEQDSTIDIAVYSAKTKIYNPNWFTKFLIDVVFKFIAKVGGKFKYTDTKKQTLNSARENALSVVPLPTNVSVLDFDKATQRSDYLMLKSHLQTQRHLNNHGVGKFDATVELKELFIEVYETLKFKKKSRGISIKITQEIKADTLLKYAKSEQFNDHSHEDVCKEFILDACLNKKKNSLDINTEAMKILVEKLNSPTCPDEVKQQFIRTVRIHDNDKRLTQEKSFAQHIADFKFTKQDFAPLIERNRNMIRENFSNRAFSP